jgi:Tfp pilus assembly protein FimT
MMTVSYRTFPSSFRRAQRGMSAIELIVTMGILTALIAFTLPRLNSSVLNLPLVSQSLIGDIRMARANATTRGVHYQISIESSSYSVQRLQDDDGDGAWDPDSAFPTQTVELPTDISITEGTGSLVEFTTRGLLADQEDGTPAEIITIKIHDALHNEDEIIEVWPSGQVEEV